MDAMHYSDAQINFIQLIETTCDNHMPCIITGGKQAAVIMSLEDYQSMEETLYLLGNPNNAKRLLQSLDQLGTPATRERDLLP